MNLILSRAANPIDVLEETEDLQITHLVKYYVSLSLTGGMQKQN